MKRTLSGLVVALGLAAAAVAAEPPKLTDVQQLRAQLQLAQEQLLQAQYQLATCQAQQRAAQLGQERQTLDKQFASPGFVFDWETLKFKPAPEPKP